LGIACQQLRHHFKQIHLLKYSQNELMSAAMIAGKNASPQRLSMVEYFIAL